VFLLVEDEEYFGISTKKLLLVVKIFILIFTTNFLKKYFSNDVRRI